MQKYHVSILKEIKVTYTKIIQRLKIL